jgi:hypothetical protein
MNVASILTKAYRITNTNSTTLLDGNSTNVLADLNTAYGHRTLMILKVKQDLNHNIKEVYTDLKSTSGLVAGDLGFNGEYPFESDTLRPVRIEVSYDGLTWKPCTIYDINENNLSEHDDVNDGFSEENPYVRFERDSYFIRPVKEDAGDITAGIHIWTEKRQSDLTTGSPLFEQNLHDVLAYDLAEQELLMHPAKYSNEWRNDFRTKKAELDSLFDDFHKNRFKRSFKIKMNNENYE